MATDNNDILIDADGDDIVKDGDVDIGDGTIDDCLIIFRTNKGDVKSDPLLGPNIIRMINAAQTPTEMKQELMLNLRMDAKEPKKLNIKDGNIDFEI